MEKHKDTFSKHTHKDNLPLTTSETELGYHRHRWKVRVAPRVVKQLKPEYIRKLGNFWEVPKVLTILLENFKKSPLRHFTETPIFA